MEEESAEATATVPDSASAKREAVDAVILAGSVNRIPLFPGNKPGFKALVPMQGKPMIDTVVEALRGCPSVRRICVVGAEQVRRHLGSSVDLVVPAGRSLVTNAWRGLEAAETERILYCNPDQPLLRPAMIEDFLERALAVDADLVSSWVAMDRLGPYRGGEHKYSHFGDGRFAHGNLFLVRKNFPHAPEARRRMDALYRGRKHVLRFAWALGPRLFSLFVFALLTRRLPRLHQTFEIASKAFDLEIRAVLCSYPEIILDIDEPEDYRDMVEYLNAGLPGEL